MKQKETFKFIFSLIFTIGMLFMLGGCGSGGGGGGDAEVVCKSCDVNPTDADSKTATGTYTYDADTGTLRVDITSSDFGNCGPSVGISDVSVVSLTSDTMILESDDSGTQIWTSISGGSGDILGTWLYTQGTGTLTSIIELDGSLTVTGTMDCSGSSSDAYASLLGTWEMTQDAEGDHIASGIVMLDVTSTTYSVTSPVCTETGTYTVNGSILSIAVETAVGTDCSTTPGNVGIFTFNATSTTLAMTDGDGTMIWNRL